MVDVAAEIAPDARAAVAGVVKDLANAFNAKDPVAMGELYAARASWTNAAGRRLDGRAEIVAFSAPAMTGFLRDAYARYEVAAMLAITPDVIAVNVEQTPVDAAGAPSGGAHGRALYVIARQADGWRIVAGQNTAIDAPAA
ncbi:SgcJ/EcaC family oxidoreductase [Streptomyces sp. RFCAC02]|uniref:SgcJ/EcaC family oxidoreductase n=1 Tax=Streptomyces sp. RFCAC02 TaxID=2499143 RepID=UPI001020FFFD|nr:SgcJ/EcaC family oxidoreductase [Streptomyces sp. RFCAC02]